MLSRTLLKKTFGLSSLFDWWTEIPSLDWFFFLKLNSRLFSLSLTTQRITLKTAGSDVTTIASSEEDETETGLNILREMKANLSKANLGTKRPAAPPGDEQPHVTVNPPAPFKRRRPDSVGEREMEEETGSDLEPRSQDDIQLDQIPQLAPQAKRNQLAQLAAEIATEIRNPASLLDGQKTPKNVLQVRAKYPKLTMDEIILAVHEEGVPLDQDRVRIMHAFYPNGLFLLGYFIRFIGSHS